MNRKIEKIRVEMVCDQESILNDLIDGLKHFIRRSMKEPLEQAFECGKKEKLHERRDVLIQNIIDEYIRDNYELIE